MDMRYAGDTCRVKQHSNRTCGPTGNLSWSHFLYSEMRPEIVLQILTVLQPHDRTIGKTEEEKEDNKEREEGREEEEDWN